MAANTPPLGFQFIGGRWVIPKSQASNLDYGIRMKYWLVPGDSLPANPLPIWEVSDGLTVESQGVVDDPTWGPTAYIKVSGGGAPGSYEWARCTWTTTQGRTETQTLNFLMVTK